MVFVSFIIILAIFFAFAEDRGLIKNGLKISFWLIVIVFSLRYGYGNDFKEYEEWFYNIKTFSSLTMAINGRPDIEVGWVVLNYLCIPLGFQFVIAITTFCVCYIYFYLIYKYVPKPYRWVGVLIFLMYPNLFVLNLSMLRQGLAGALFLFSFFKGYESKWIQSFIFCLLAVSVHQVAIICIPFILMINFKRFLNPVLLVLLVLIVFIALLFNPTIIETVFINIMSNELAYESYSNYISKGGSEDVTLALISRIAVIIPCIFWFKGLKELDKYLTIMFCISPFAILLSTQTVLLLRLECFFLPFSTLLFSRMLLADSLFEIPPKNKMLSGLAMRVASFGWVLFSVRSFFHFFSEPTYAKHFANFHTVFSGWL